MTQASADNSVPLATNPKLEIIRLSRAYMSQDGIEELAAISQVRDRSLISFTEDEVLSVH